MWKGSKSSNTFAWHVSHPTHRSMQDTIWSYFCWQHEVIVVITDILQMTLLGVICYSTRVEKARECKQSIKQQLWFFFVVVVFLHSLHSFFFNPSQSQGIFPARVFDVLLCLPSYDKHRGQVSEVYLNLMLLESACLYPSLILSLTFHHHLSALLCVLYK